MMRLISKFLFLCLICFLWTSSALAQASDWKGNEKAQVRLISALTHVGNGNEILLGLQFKLAKNWKVYWRSPGDAGYPPEIDWTGSENFTDAEIKWPRPHRFMVLGLETVGYKDEVVYPIALKVQDTQKAATLKAHVRFLTCDDVCIPVETDLALSLNPGAAAPSEHAQLINKFNSLVPLKTTQGITIESATLYPDTDQKKGSVRVLLKTDWALNQPDALMEGPIELAFFKPDIALTKDKKSTLIDVPLDGLQFLEQSLADQTLRLTFMDGLRAFEMDLPIQLASTPLPPSDGYIPLGQESLASLSLLSVLGLAVLGGLILNLMPCVLPVLSLKVLGVVSHGGAAKSTVRLSFLASAAGIIFSFLILALVLILMKHGGVAIGWGIQFQQPLFLIALILIVILFACNMWGFFEINLPSWLSDLGERSSHVHGLGGHFLTGAFATLLATPCSAPFLGTAVGFALSQGSTEILLVFCALGVGLALPYLLIALMPGFATRLPKPGKWMVHLRKVLGLALLGTAVWLLTVLMAQIGMNGAVILSVLMAVIIVVLAFKTSLKQLAKPLVIALFAVSFAIPGLAQKDSVNKVEAEKIWTRFDEAEISKFVQRGQVVFVDVTAEWCITCQVNKNLVLYRGDAYDALQQDGLIAMKADWTNPDDTIAAYLASFKRYAIPFNAVYGPGAPEGIVLPELLSEDDVLSAIQKAKG